MKKLISSDEIEKLELLNLQLERIEGALKMYAVLFEDSGAFSKVSPSEVSTALYGVYDQVHKLDDVFNSIIESLVRGERYEDQRISEIVKMMHEQLHKDDTNDIKSTEIVFFRDQVSNGIKSGDKDAIIDVIWDAYLFGVYRGQHGADQEG